MSENAITVAALIERLRNFDQTAFVMIDCAESLYAGAIHSADDIYEGSAVYVRGELTKMDSSPDRSAYPAVFIKTPFT